MLEPSETDASHRCAQCSYRADWPFQLHYHNQKSHGDVHTSELFAVMAEPELYRCADCDFKTSLKLVRYEHCTREHDNRNNEDGDIKSVASEEGFEACFCRYCEYKGHSSLILVKHDVSCEIIHKDSLASASLGAKLTADFDNDVKPQNLIFIDCGDGRQHNRYSCKDKNESIVDKPSVKHVATADSDGWFCCSKCSYRCKVKRYLTRHMRVHLECDQIKWFSCNTCTYRAKRRQYLEKHIAKAHSKSGQKCDETELLNCVKCSYRTKSKRYLTRHMRVHARPERIEWFSCTNCSYRTKWKKDLKLHLLITHGEIIWFSCTECSFRSKYENGLKEHMRIVHETNVFYCSKCSYGTKRKGDLKKHMLKHATSDDADVEWKQCPKCAYGAKDTGRLNAHMRTHAADDEIEWFDCPKCEYRAKRKEAVRTHLVTHARPEEIQWIQCSACSFKSKRTEYLRRHVVLMHGAPTEKVDWYDCAKCPYRAKLKANLTRHVNKVHLHDKPNPNVIFIKTENGGRPE